MTAEIKVALLFRLVGGFLVGWELGNLLTHDPVNVFVLILGISLWVAGIMGGE